MQAEMLKIIEGGLSGDRTKVYNYASTLANNLEREGEARFAAKVRNALSGKKPGFATLDGMSARPVDQESRMDIVNVEYVADVGTDLVLSQFLEDEVNSFVSLYSNRSILESRGIEAGSRLLLYGPPGCGKTSIARLIAARTNLPLVTAQFDGLVSSLLGSTAKNIRKVFDFATRQECVLFLDEFDVVAKKRDDENELGELKRVVNSLIQNIDSFAEASILIAATNHHELLDPAIWRRFNRTIEVPMPSRREVEIYAEKRIFPLMSARLRPRQIGCLEGLSYSTLDTVTKNSLCEAAMKGRNAFTSFELMRQTYIVRKHGISDEDDLIEYMIVNGCSQTEIHEGLGASLRKIKEMAKTMKEEGSL